MRKRPRRGMPSKVKVLDVTFEVGYFSELKDLCKEKDAKGIIDPTACKIYIFDHQQPRAELWAIFWHEILHGIVDRMEIKEISDHPREEDIIQKLAVGINAVLRDNGFIS